MTLNGRDASMDAAHSRTGETAMSFLHSSIDDIRDALGTGLLRAGAALLVVAVTVSACRDPLDIPDPNSIQGEDLDNPAAVPSLVSGSLKNTNEMIGELAAIYGAASDEIRWIGSRDAWQSLSQGFLDDPVNEFSDAAYPDVTDARFMADRAISKAEEFEGQLADQNDLVRAYLQGAVVYATIADTYDDFVIPDDPQEAAPSIGSGNMGQLYDQAIQWLDSAESMARDLDSPELVTRAIAYRARVRHAKAVWNKLNPPGTTPSDPLVEDAEMAQDAQAALGRIGLTADWRWEATFSSASAVNNLGFQVNERGELQFGPEYVEVVEGNESNVEAVVLTDPVTGEPSPVFQRRLSDFQSGGQFSSLYVTTAREMHLLLAEHRLAQQDTAGFETHINHVRTIAGQEQYTGPGQVPVMEMLEHTRQANLVIMNRRLADMYRFGVTSARWLPQSPAATEPGTFFPIAITEVRSNPEVGG